MTITVWRQRCYGEWDFCIRRAYRTLSIRLGKIGFDFGDLSL